MDAHERPPTDAERARQAQVMLVAAGGLRASAAMLGPGDDIGEQLAHCATEMALAAQVRAGAGPAIQLVRDGGAGVRGAQPCERRWRSRPRGEC